MTEIKLNWRIRKTTINKEKVFLSGDEFIEINNDLNKLDKYEKLRNYLKEFLGIY